MADENGLKEAFTIEIPVSEATNALFLKQTVGDGQYEGDPVALEATLPSYCPLIGFRGERYFVDINDIVKAVCAQVLAASEGGDG